MVAYQYNITNRQIGGDMISSNYKELEKSYAECIEDKWQLQWDIDKLKAKLIECHNKNTELKGDIARGNKDLEINKHPTSGSTEYEG